MLFLVVDEASVAHFLQLQTTGLCDSAPTSAHSILGRPVRGATPEYGNSRNESIRSESIKSALLLFSYSGVAPRTGRPKIECADLQPLRCGPAREQRVSPHTFLHFFALCTPESLFRLRTSNMTILPAKQAACDLCGIHGSAMQRLPLENWSAIVLRKTWRCREDAHMQICIFICVYVCLHLKLHMK